MQFTPKDWSFAYFSFLGVGRLILAGLSNRRCRWHRPPKNLSAVSLTPVNNFSAVSLTPAINFRLFGFSLNGINDTGEKYKLFTGVNDTGDKFFAVVVDTAEQLIPVSLTPVININSRISPRIFEKIQKGSNGIRYLGAWGTLIHEKNLNSKISCQTPFNWALQTGNGNTLKKDDGHITK